MRRGGRGGARAWGWARRSALLGVLWIAATAAPAEGQDFFERWFHMVAETQGEQPHWITPLGTTTPRLEQEFRYDIVWQGQANGTVSENYGGGKGVELIPLPRVEVIAGLPPYMVHNDAKQADGFGDFNFLTKFRILSASESHGDYILTAFFAFSYPTGAHKNGGKHAVITPTIAYGKGWGNFDVQGTIGAAMPVAGTSTLGRQIQWNNALQYRVLRKLWPEVEIQSTFFNDGTNGGKKQVFLTPGVVAGKLPVWHRLGLTVGGGIQIAATRFHTTNHNAIFSLRLPF